MRDVDGDALLAFGDQAIGQQRQVEALGAAAAAGRLDRHQLVARDRLRLVEQAADQRTLAVVDGTGGRESEEIHG